MSDESHTDLLARHLLCAFERIEELERQVTALRLGSLPSFEVPATRPPAPTETALERFLASPLPKNRRSLRSRGPALAERWRKLVL